MSDWKSRIDDWQAEILRKAEAKAKRKSEQEERRRSNAYSVDAHRHRWGQDHTLQAHQRRFRCHVCHKPSDGPYTAHAPRFRWISGRTAEDTGYHNAVEYETQVNWDQPTGLARCSRCHGWTCDVHLYKGICQRCALRLKPVAPQQVNDQVEEHS